MATTKKPEAASKSTVEAKGNHVVTSVEVPAHKAEVVIAHSPIEGCAIAAAEAWDKVKGDDDADFATATESHRRELVYAAEAVYKTAQVAEGDSIPARFEQEVARIKIEQDEAKAKAAKKAA